MSASNETGVVPAAAADVVVITGASRGIGAAMVQHWLSLRPAPRLVCVSRARNEELMAKARSQGASIEWFSHDLADAGATDAMAEQLFRDLAVDRAAGRLRSVTLVNNAALVEPLGLVPRFDRARATVALQVNLLAAMTFTAQCIRHLAGGKAVQRPAARCPIRILNVSSGAGRMPIEGWSVYCSSKAALDMYTRCVKTEQAGTADPVRICSLAPGVVDTGMQATIRGSSADTLPNVARFQQLKDSDSLVSAEAVAAQLIDYLGRPDFGEREVDDIRRVSGTDS